MLKYLLILKLGFLDALAYRTEFFVGLIGWGIRLIMAVFLWKAVAMAQNGHVGGYTFDSILGYFFLMQVISSFVFGRVAFDIARDIQRGDFSNFMLKPINYILFRFTHELSKNAFRLVIAIIIFGTAFYLFLDVPIDTTYLGIGIVTLMGGYIIHFLLTTIIALLSFWIVNAIRLLFIYFGILTIFSGMVLPIDLFPPRFAEIIGFLPFQYIFYFPAKLLDGSMPTGSMHNGLLIMTMYLFILGFFTYVMYCLGVKRFEAIGR